MPPPDNIYPGNKDGHISMNTFARAASMDFNLIRPTHHASKSPMEKRTKRNRARNKMARESRRRNR